MSSPVGYTAVAVRPRHWASVVGRHPGSRIAGARGASVPRVPIVGGPLGVVVAAVGGVVDRVPCDWVLVHRVARHRVLPRLAIAAPGEGHSVCLCLSGRLGE